MMKKLMVMLTAVLMIIMPCVSSMSVYAASDVTEYEVPVFLEHYYVEGKASMGNKALNPTARVIERNGRMTYILQLKSMEYLSMDGEVTNIFVYHGDKDTNRQEALKMSIDDNGYNQSYMYSRNQKKEKVIHIAVWVDAMDAIANPDAYVPGAGEENAKLVFDWSKAKKVTANVETSELTLMVNHTEVFSDAAPYIANGRTMVPVRFISEALGMPVGWNGVTKTVSVGEGSSKMSLKIGDASIKKSNGSTVQIDSPAVIVSGRTMVPVRAIAELSGAKVGWDGATSTVEIVTELQ